jgi:hypothetical protein
MRLLIAALLLAGAAMAQPVTQPPAILKGAPPGGPGGSCTSSTTGYMPTTGIIYTCPPSTHKWTAVGGGGGGGSTIHLPVAFASLPGTCTSGDMYMINNSVYISAVCGASNTYTYYGSLGNLIPPPTTGWSWVNQGSSTIDTTNGFTEGDFPLTNATALSGRCRTAPSTPYTITAYLLTGNGHESGPWLGWTDGTKFVTIRWGQTGSNAHVVTDKWTTATSFSAAYTEVSGVDILQYPTALSPSVVRIADDGTNLIVSLSVDGYHFRQFDSQSRTNFMTTGPTSVCFGGYNNSSNVDVALIGWRVE